MPSQVFDTEDSEGGLTGLGQVFVVVLSLLWAFFPGFGLIDLDTAIPPGDPKFHEHWVLEGGWGVLVTALIVVPLVVVAMRPGMANDVAKHQVVLVGCFVVAAALSGVGGFLVLPVGLGLSTLAWWWPLRTAQTPTASGRARRRWPLALLSAGYLGLPLVLFGPDAFTVKTVGILVGMAALTAWLVYPSPMIRDTVAGVRRVSWALLVASVAAAGPWLAYTLRMAAESRSGFEYVGSCVDRVVAQAALPLAMVALPLAAAVGWLPTRLAVWPAAVAGACFGWFAVCYPEHLASPGAAWGVAALVGSICLVLVAEAAVHLRPRK